MSRLRAIPRLQLVAAILVGIIAGVHFQQYIDFMSEIPTVGILFLLNAAGGGALMFALISSDRFLRLNAILGAAGLAFGALVSVIIALTSSFFGYTEPSLRLPIIIAIAAEALILPVLAALAVHEFRQPTPAKTVEPAPVDPTTPAS